MRIAGLNDMMELDLLVDVKVLFLLVLVLELLLLLLFGLSFLLGHPYL